MANITLLKTKMVLVRENTDTDDSTLDSTLDSGATSPTDSPTLTPKFHALKLNPSDSTWRSPHRKKRRSKRRIIKAQLQSKGQRVLKIVHQAKESKIKQILFLAALLTAAICLVTFTWKWYHDHVAQLEIGHRLRFHHARRELALLRDTGDTVLRGRLGISLPPRAEAYKCSASHICLEWKYRARLAIHSQRHGNISCYNIRWRSLSSEHSLLDCLDLKDAYWYGLGESLNASWPLQQNDETFYPFVTGNLDKTQLGRLLERYWVSSRGSAILVEPDETLFLRINTNGSREICLSSRHQFPYRYPSNSLPTLNYTICTGPDVLTVHRWMLKLIHPQPFVKPRLDFVETPVWSAGSLLYESLNKVSLRSYANDIMEHGLPAGIILLDTKWQKMEGDLTFKSNYLNRTSDVFSILHHKGFKIIIPIYPYVCLGSATFEHGVHQRYFISNPGHGTPVLVRWRNQVCGLIELTKSRSAVWFHGEITKLREKHKVDGYVFKGGISSVLPNPYFFVGNFSNPDLYLRHYHQLGQRSSPLFGVTAGFQTQSLAGGAVFLSPRHSTWAGLQSVIPLVLTYGLLGYPLVDPGSVGGNSVPFPAGTHVSEELYLRWMELAAFMPVLEFSLPPTFNSTVLAAARRLLAVRTELVLPAIREALEQYARDGTPVIRPLWWDAPRDPNTWTIRDQFFVGSKLLVAPVLNQGRTSRELYLPVGWWRDELHQTNTWRGGRWLTGYEVHLDQIAYFSRAEEPL